MRYAYPAAAATSQQRRRQFPADAVTIAMSASARPPWAARPRAGVVAVVVVVTGIDLVPVRLAWGYCVRLGFVLRQGWNTVLGR
jgi:hypothetical protein